MHGSHYIVACMDVVLRSSYNPIADWLLGRHTDTPKFAGIPFDVWPV